MRELAEKIYKASENTANDYDAIEAIQKILEDNNFEIPKISSGEEQPVIVFSEASSMSMDVEGVFESEEQLLQYLRERYGDNDLTIAEMMSYGYQDEMEIQIEKTTLYKQKVIV